MHQGNIKTFRGILMDHADELHDSYQEIGMDDSIEPLTVEVSSQRATGIDPKRLHLTVSSGLPPNDPPIMSRVLTCRQYWTPSLLSIQQEQRGPFSLRLALQR